MEFILVLENANRQRINAPMTLTEISSVDEYNTVYSMECRLAQAFSIWSNQGANWIIKAEIQTPYGSVELYELDVVGHDNLDGNIEGHTVTNDIDANYEIFYKNHNITQVVTVLTVTEISDDECH